MLNSRWPIQSAHIIKIMDTKSTVKFPGRAALQSMARGIISNGTSLEEVSWHLMLVFLQSLSCANHFADFPLYLFLNNFTSHAGSCKFSS